MFNNNKNKHLLKNWPLLAVELHSEELFIAGAVRPKGPL